MYGKRARIGLIVPSSNTVCEPEMARLCPEGVNTYAARVLFEPTLKGLTAMKDHLARAALELASENICQIIAFCCTVGSMMGGPDYDRELGRFIEEISGQKAVTTTSAVKSAFKALGVRKLALVTPYTNQINRTEKEMLEADGFQVTDMIGYHRDLAPDQLKNDSIGRLSPEESYALSLKIDSAQNEAVFISCTNFRSIEIISKLENTVGKPVVTSNQATMWHALRTLGIRDKLAQWGKLFEE